MSSDINNSDGLSFMQRAVTWLSSWVPIPCRRRKRRQRLRPVIPIPETSASIHTSDDSSAIGHGQKEEAIRKAKKVINMKFRTYSSIRDVVESDHAVDLQKRLDKIRTSAWFYRPEEVEMRTQSLFRAREANASVAKYDILPLTKNFHVRPLQWYGCRMTSLSRGWMTADTRENMGVTEDTENLNDSVMFFTSVWSVATFAILDADGRAFPFLMEYHGAFDDTDARAYIYTCKQESDDCKQPGKDVCVGRIIGNWQSSSVTLNLERLRAALPYFSIYRPHDVDETARMHCGLSHFGRGTYYTSVDYNKNGEGHRLFPVYKSEAGEFMGTLEPFIEWQKQAKRAESAEELLTSMNCMNLPAPFPEWRSKLREFYSSLTPDELLQNQLEIMFGSAASPLFERIPTHAFTENQPTALRHRLTVEALTRLSPSEAKAFTSAALPPVSLNSAAEASATERPRKKQRGNDEGSQISRDEGDDEDASPAIDSVSRPKAAHAGRQRAANATSEESTSSSTSKWPHADVVWGPAESRPLPNELIRLIAEYSLDELELVDLPWIEEQTDEEKNATVSREAQMQDDEDDDNEPDHQDHEILRGSRVVFGKPCAEEEEGDFEHDDDCTTWEDEE